MVSFVIALTVFTTALQAATIVEIVTGTEDETSFVLQTEEYQLKMQEVESSVVKTSLRISDSVIGYHDFLKFVNLFPALEKITLYNVDVTVNHDSWENLGTLPETITDLTIQQCKKMNDLVFFHLTTVALKNLKSIRMAHSTLRSLNNDDLCLVDECSNAHVTSLDFHMIEWEESQEASRFFVTLMKFFTGLSKLHVYYFAVGGGELTRLLEKYPAPMAKVTNLDLIHGEITADNFPRVLSKFPNVETLDIRDNPIGTGFEGKFEEQKLRYILAGDMPLPMTAAGFVNLISHCPDLEEINVRGGMKNVVGLQKEINSEKFKDYFKQRQETLIIAIDDNVEGNKELIKFCSEKINAEKIQRCTVYII